MSVYRFYLRNADNLQDDADPSQLDFACELWRPSFLSFMPTGLKSFTFFVWWIFHQARVFTNREYSVILLRDIDGEIAHRSTITPKYFRFPFMAKDDLQIGDVWTSEKYRGKGLAFLAVKKVLEAYAPAKTKIWYLVEETNVASIKLAEKAGFVLWGQGERHSPMGINFLGKYLILSENEDI